MRDVLGHVESELPIHLKQVRSLDKVVIATPLLLCAIYVKVNSPFLLYVSIHRTPKLPSYKLTE